VEKVEKVEKVKNEEVKPGLSLLHYLPSRLLIESSFCKETFKITRIQNQVREPERKGHC